MLSIINWPRAILHLDGNAFFASVMQSAFPKYKGKPVVVGAERGIATAISYEARPFGITRGMRMFEIKKLCPQCIILEGDYELFSVYSNRMFSILREFSPVVDEYSVDEGFADLTGMRRPLNGTYEEIGKRIQDKVQLQLGIPVSVGISITKTLAKLASEFKKPSGFTIVPGTKIEEFLAKIPIEDVWGIGPATTAYLHKFGIKTALQFIKVDSSSRLKLNKNHYEIMEELRGTQIYELNPNAKTNYKSMSCVRTFHPPTNNKQLLWSRLRENIEEVFTKARTYNYRVKRVSVFLKTQKFTYNGSEIRFPNAVVFPLSALGELQKSFESIYKSEEDYRATGCVLTELTAQTEEQPPLFSEETTKQSEKISRLYNALKNKKIDFGTSLWQKKNKDGSTKTIPRLSVPLLELTS